MSESTQNPECARCKACGGPVESNLPHRFGEKCRKCFDEDVERSATRFKLGWFFTLALIFTGWVVISNFQSAREYKEQQKADSAKELEISEKERRVRSLGKMLGFELGHRTFGRPFTYLPLDFTETSNLKSEVADLTEFFSAESKRTKQRIGNLYHGTPYSQELEILLFCSNRLNAHSDSNQESPLEELQKFIVPPQSGE